MRWIENLKNKRFIKKLNADRKHNTSRKERYTKFLSEGGALSGVYNIKDKKTKQFVKKYKEFIPRREIYKRDKRGNLVPVYKR